MKKIKIILITGLTFFYATNAFTQLKEKEIDSVSELIAINSHEIKELVEKQKLSKKIREEAFSKQIEYLKAKQDTLKRQIQHFRQEEEEIRIQEQKQIQQLKLQKSLTQANQTQKELENFQQKLEENYEVKLNQKISLIKEMNFKDVQLDVNKAVFMLVWKISASIYTGHVAIELYDPNGVKREQFTLDGDSKARIQSLEGVSGAITKEIKYPDKGSWKIKIIPQKATGDLELMAAYLLQDLGR